MRAFKQKYIFLYWLVFTLVACGGEDDLNSQCDKYSQPVTSEVHEGDFEIYNQASLERAIEFTEITGNLNISVSAELPNLLKIGGDLHIDSSPAEYLLLPNLTEIGDTLWVYLNLELLDLDLRNLERVEQRIFIHRNANLTALNLDSLEFSGVDEMSLTDQLVLPSCLLQPLRDQFGDIHASTGNTNCTCQLECGRLVASCAE